MDIRQLLIDIDRRRFLKGGAALAASSLLPSLSYALSSAPYQFKQADVEVTVLSDGHLTIPIQVLAPEATPEELAEIEKQLGWSGGMAMPATNIPLIRSGGDVILVDIGSGEGFQPTAGKLSEGLAASAVDPASVTKIVFTHAHPDHIWATLSGGNLRFPNATYYVASAEWDFWTDPELASKMPPEMGDFVKGAQRDLAAVKERVTMVKPGDDIVTGIRVLDTGGHTPGHISLEVSGGEGLIITADSVANQLVSFQHPEWKFGFDAIPDLAIDNRKKLLDRAATDKLKLLGFHWAYPGVGFAEKKDGAFTFAPA